MKRFFLFFNKIKFYYQRFGLLMLIKRVYQYYNIHSIINSLVLPFLKQRHYKKINQILKSKNDSAVIIYLPFHSWNTPLAQRPHHLTRALSKYFLYFFFTDNRLDNFYSIKKLSDSCYLLPPTLLKKILSLPIKKIIFLYSTPAKNYSLAMINDHLSQGDIVVYDYLDELNEEVFRVVTKDVIKRHQAILADERIICLVSANKLYKDAQKYRSNNLYLVENAVDPSHYAQPKQSIPFLEKIRPSKIIGYFGALSSWIDYALVLKLASLNPDKYVVLIGYVYDKQMVQHSLARHKNIITMDAVPYAQLPNYAQYFDVSIIPFLINETTLSTSPLKLFEYMAIGKPIVTTDLPECRKYQSSLIARNHAEFNTLVNQALIMKKDDNYFKTLSQEAKQNSWDARAKKIHQAILQNFK